MEFNLTIRPTKAPSWLPTSSNQLALHHGRVPLSYVCNAASSVRVQMRDASQIAQLTLRFLNNNSALEHTVVVDGTNHDTFWSFGEDFVPFIDRPIGDHAADVAVTLIQPAHELPVYTHGESAPAKFKQKWSLSASPYALIDIGSIVFLVPPADKKLVTSDDFDLLRLHNYYESIYAFYDSNIKVSQGAADAADRVCAKQFFCKADIRGVGLAFYSRGWLGFSSNTIESYLDIDKDPWLIMHEIGHGYEFVFVETAPPLIEVWTNILPNLYQFNTMSATERQVRAWLYGYGARAAVESELNALIDNGADYVNFPFRQQLFAYAPMTQTNYGKQAFQQMHREFRQFSLRGGGPSEYFIADWWSNASQVDCLPLFLLMQQHIVSKCMYGTDVHELYTFERALGALKRVAYPACRLLRNFDTLTNNYGIQHLETGFAPIFPAQSAASVANLVIVIHIDDLAQIANELVEIYDGAQLVHSQTVHDKRVYLQAPIAVGVYNLIMPRGRDRRYSVSVPQNKFNERGNNCTNLYLVVTNATTQIDVEYTPKDRPDLATRAVGYVLGFADKMAAEFAVDTINRVVRLRVFTKVIHGIFSQYFTIGIYRNDVQVEELVVRGNHSAAAAYQSVNYQINDVMTLTFWDNAPRNRVIFMGTHLQQLQSRYLLAENDVYDLSDQHLISKEQQMRTKLENDARFLDAHPFLLRIENCLRDDMLLMVKALPDGAALFDTYRRYLPKHFQQNAAFAPPLGAFIAIVIALCLLLALFVIAYVVLTAAAITRHNDYLRPIMPQPRRPPELPVVLLSG